MSDEIINKLTKARDEFAELDKYNQDVGSLLGILVCLLNLNGSLNKADIALMSKDMKSEYFKHLFSSLMKGKVLK